MTFFQKVTNPKHYSNTDRVGRGEGGGVGGGSLLWRDFKEFRQRWIFLHHFAIYVYSIKWKKMNKCWSECMFVWYFPSTFIWWHSKTSYSDVIGKSPSNGPKVAFCDCRRLSVTASEQCLHFLWFVHNNKKVCLIYCDCLWQSPMINLRYAVMLPIVAWHCSNTVSGLLSLTVTD